MPRRRPAGTPSGRLRATPTRRGKRSGVSATFSNTCRWRSWAPSNGRTLRTSTLRKPSSRPLAVGGLLGSDRAARASRSASRPAVAAAPRTRARPAAARARERQPRRSLRDPRATPPRAHTRPRVGDPRRSADALEELTPASLALDQADVRARESDRERHARKAGAAPQVGDLLSAPEHRKLQCHDRVLEMRLALRASDHGPPWARARRAPAPPRPSRPGESARCRAPAYQPFPVKRSRQPSSAPRTVSGRFP